MTKNVAYKRKVYNKLPQQINDRFDIHSKSWKFCLCFFIKPKGQGLAFDTYNLLRKADFLLKSGFQDIAIFIPLEEGYLVIIVINVVYKWVRELFSGYQKIMSEIYIFWIFFWLVV